MNNIPTKSPLLTPLKTLILFAILCLIISLTYIIEHTHFKHFFSLEYIKHQQETYTNLYYAHPLKFILGYVVVYICVTSLSIPIANVLALTAGAVFGFFTGFSIVLITSTIGSTFSFIMARWLLKDFIQNRYKDRLKRINSGMHKEGIFYLFAMRFFPAIPFWLTNILMGLTHMKLFTYTWVSMLGMIAGIAVHVNAGEKLGEIESAKDILSLNLLISLALLGLLPLAAKWIINFIRKRYFHERNIENK